MSVTRKVSPIKVDDPPEDDLGPAMVDCAPMQRRFVIAYAACGDATAAARSAGYSDVGDGAKVRGFELLRHPKVIAGLKEWTSGALNGRGAFVAISALIEIAGDPEHSDRMKAADSILDRTGFSRQTSHQVSVEHTDNRSTADLMAVLEQVVQRRQALTVIEGEAVEVASGAA